MSVMFAISKNRRQRTWVRSREENPMFCIEKFDKSTQHVSVCQLSGVIVGKPETS
jgi:hypothetical protein